MKVEDMAEEGLNKRLGTMGYLNRQNVAKPYTDGFKDGFKACAKERLNVTTISDCLIKDDQLIKAIGIIKRWYETNRSACIEPSQELIEVTEQFIREIEK